MRKYWDFWLAGVKYGLGNRIRQASMEAGARWMLGDISGNPIRAWDSRGHTFTSTYDTLRRPIEQRVSGTTSESDPRTLDRTFLTDRIEYGEPPADATAAEEARAQRLNLRTQVYRQHDNAGIVTHARLDANGAPLESYDFKGNPLEVPGMRMTTHWRRRSTAFIKQN